MSGRTVLKAEHASERREQVHGWPVRISSFLLGERWHATVANEDSGARIARGDGVTREEAEGLALTKAQERLARTRTFSTS